MQNDVNKTQLFYDYYQQWIEVYKRGAIRDATMAKYLMTQKWVKKLVPELKVCELTRTTYQKLLNDYAKEHERQTTLDFHHQLKGAILDAVDDGLIERDPTRKAKGNDIINSGAVKGALTDKNDPLYVKRDAHAIKYYESVRRSKKNNMVKTIANNTGISEKNINKVYDHVFIKEHELYGGKRRFDPDYDMAESFRRLREGKNIQEHDLIMLKHERLEYELMNKKHMSYQEAHRLAEKKYNYQKALKEFKNKNNL